MLDWGLLRRIISRGGSLYAAVILGLTVRDLTGGFKCFRADVLEAIDLPSVEAYGYAFQVELTNRAIRHGFRVVEVPITFRDRLRGKSKMSAKIAVEAMFLVPRLRSRAARAEPAAERERRTAGSRVEVQRPIVRGDGSRACGRSGSA